MVRIFIVEHILKPLNNHRRLGSSYHGCFGMQSKHTLLVEPPHPALQPPKTGCFSSSSWRPR